MFHIIKERIEKLLADKRKRELISYLFFGGLTTLISIASYWVFTRGCGFGEVTGNVGSWVISVAFAYVTNRRWVFESKKQGALPILGEATAFVASRVFSGITETLLIFIFAEKLGIYDMAVKIAATVITILLNYILSKIVVFRKHETT